MRGFLVDISEPRAAQNRLARQQRSQAIQQERERLARELHDSLGPVLGCAGAQVQVARDQLAKGQAGLAHASLARVVTTLQEAQVDVSDYVPGVCSPLSPEQGLLGALLQHVQRFGRSFGLRTEIVLPEDRTSLTFAPDVEAQLLRIIQEALTNVRKHASAHSVRVMVAVLGDQAQFTVADDGRGFDPERLSGQSGQTFGLRAMRERAEEVGATLQVVSAVGQGTKVILKIPTVSAREPRLLEDYASVTGATALPQ